MRPSAVFPLACAAAAVVLAFLCLFAGSQKGFMEDYHIVTLNVSQIGQNLINSSSIADDLPSSLQGLIQNITSSINNDVNQAVKSIATQLGLDDFYSYHMLDYCFGDYVPQAVPNATLHGDEIHKDVLGCSNRTAMFEFDPKVALENSLANSNVSISFDDLQWPDKIETAIHDVRIAAKATFVLYCIGIGLAFVAFVTSLMGFFSSSRITAFINMLTALLAFIALAIASAAITAIVVKGSNAINKYGEDIGVEAHRGGKFLAITWAATGSMFLAIAIWSLECCFNHKRTPRAYAEKPARV